MSATMATRDLADPSAKLSDHSEDQSFSIVTETSEPSSIYVLVQDDSEGHLLKTNKSKTPVAGLLALAAFEGLSW
jgi:hypothetical protein